MVRVVESCDGCETAHVLLHYLPVLTNVERLHDIVPHEGLVRWVQYDKLEALYHDLLCLLDRQKLPVVINNLAKLNCRCVADVDLLSLIELNPI